MKRKCKNVDITSMKFICDAVQDCLNHKTTEKLNRKRTRKYLDEHDNDINKIALEIQNEIKNRNLVRYAHRYIMLSCISQQNNHEEKRLSQMQKVIEKVQEECMYKECKNNCFTKWNVFEIYRQYKVL